MPTLKLSQSVAEKLNPQGSDEVYFDEKLPGFGIRITQNGAKSWIVHTRSKGRQLKKKIGRIDLVGYGEARSQAIAIFRAIQTGADPFDSKHAHVSSFAELFEHYMSGHARKLKKSTSADEDQRLINNHILPRLKHVRPVDLSRPIVVDLRNSVAGLNDKVSQNSRLGKVRKGIRGGKVTSNRCLAVLQKAMNFAVSEGILDRPSNPVAGVPRFKEYRKEHYLDIDQVGMLRSAIKNARKLRSENSAALDAIELLLLTGGRKSEINCLVWEEVDFENECLKLRDSKTGARKIALCSRAQQILKRRSITRRKSITHVFPGCQDDAPVSLRKPWDRLKRAAQIGREYSLHTLRHTYATLAAAAGVNAWELKDLLGHQSIETTSIHVKVAERQTHQNAQAISSLLRSSKKHQK